MGFAFVGLAASKKIPTNLIDHENVAHWNTKKPVGAMAGKLCARRIAERAPGY